ncbi:MULTISPECIES: hypothetical protein [unclassified Methanoculleus]|jgi:hypothetical protein|uniref:hypothetical protein n=2 Tax=Methanoculleus TaxID=45989 RepID=UPI0025D4A24C|nr:hypothetical protein [Methanoculleus sp. UBA377]
MDDYLNVWHWMQKINTITSALLEANFRHQILDSELHNPPAWRSAPLATFWQPFSSSEFSWSSAAFCYRHLVTNRPSRMPAPAPLAIVPPSRYQGTAVNESDMAVTVLVLNQTIAPEAMASSNPELDQAVNFTPVHIEYPDTHDLYTLKPGEYSTAWHESGDGDDMLEPGEVVELTLPLQQPIPANTRVSADFATFYRGTLVLLFRTPDVIESSGQILEFTAEPFVPH